MRKAFTMIELLIVIAIIAILASTIIPNFIGFDSEAKVSATRTNLDTLRTTITLYRAKEGKYPQSLGDLVNTYYNDQGVKKAYLNKMPVEMITNSSGNSDYFDTTSDKGFTNNGGWIYFQDTADVKINSDEPLPEKWKDYANNKPSEW
jgi:prepilin-type N-terminal cleavage/methylation domain-containing protein